MIDSRYQGRGYGRKALKLGIKFFSFFLKRIFNSFSLFLGRPNLTQEEALNE